VEQAGRVAAGNRGAVGHGGRERAVAVSRAHLVQQRGVRARGRRLPVVGGQEMRGAIDLRVDGVDRGPGVGRGRQPPVEQAFHAAERVAGPPFSAARCREAWLRLRRSYKRNPAAQRVATGRRSARDAPPDNPAHHLGLAISASLHRALNRAHPAHALLELFLGVAVRLEERNLHGLAQVVKLAELMRHIGQHSGDRVADGVLPVRDDAGDQHGQRGDGFPEQRRQVVADPAQETPRQKDLAREAVAQDPEHVMLDIWLQPVERQDHAPCARSRSCIRR